MSPTSINSDYLGLGERLDAALKHPAIDGLYLPTSVPDETFRDEFGFVFLDDGSIGPFYVSMNNILQNLWQRYTEPSRVNTPASEFLQGFVQQDITERALAVGTYNALSAACMHQAGFVPPDRAPQSGLDAINDGDRVGMVGYFCPLVDRLIARGCEVMMLELAPERVSGRDDVNLTRKVEDLLDCRLVLCTASTLINDTLQSLLNVIAGKVPIELVGPSGSGLPDPLFSRGVASVGGILFDDRDKLIESLEHGESWGAAGRKYQLVPSNYPGTDSLLSDLTTRR